MESKKAHEIFETARTENRLLSFYTEPGTSQFDVGFVEAWSENHLVIRTVSTSGCAMGFSLRPIEEIRRIEWETEYLEGIYQLWQRKGTTHPADFLPEVNLASDLCREFLLAAQKHDFAVEVDTGCDDDPMGFVQEVELTTLTLESYTRQGQRDGISVLVLEEIEELEADNTKLRDLKLLARWSDQTPPL